MASVFGPSSVGDDGRSDAVTSDLEILDCRTAEEETDSRRSEPELHLRSRLPVVNHTRTSPRKVGFRPLADNMILMIISSNLGIDPKPLFWVCTSDKGRFAIPATGTITPERRGWLKATRSRMTLPRTGEAQTSVAFVFRRDLLQR